MKVFAGICQTCNRGKSINQTFYYNKNDNHFKDLGNTQDLTIIEGPMDGTTFTVETTLAVENVFGSQTWVVSDGDGNKWTVSYKASFIGLEGDDVVAKALENDPTANKMVFDEDLSTAGTWNPNDRTLSIGSNRRKSGESNRGGTIIHEI